MGNAVGNAFSKTRAPRLIVFNLDNTLIRASKMHPLEPYHEALSRILPENKLPIAMGEDRVIMDGRTDRQIIRDIASANRIKLSDEQVIRAAREVPEAIKDNAQPGGIWGWEPLPGVPRLIRSLYSRADCVIGLCTGNEQYTTGLKMDAAGLYPIFFEHEIQGKRRPMGAFGSEAEERADLLPILIELYSEWLELPLDKLTKNDVVVVANSPTQIYHAHLLDLPCVAVATGDYTVDELSDAEAIFHNFAQMHLAQGTFLTVQREYDSDTDPRILPDSMYEEVSESEKKEIT